MFHITHFFNRHFTTVPIHSWLVATLFLILGISWQAWVHDSWLFMGTLLLICVTLFALYSNKIFPLLFFSVFVLGSFVYKKQIATHNSFVDTYKNQNISAIATVINEESVTDNPRIKQMLTVRLEKICTNCPNPGTWESVDADIQFYTTRPAPLIPGDTVALFNLTIKKTKNNAFERYLIKEGIVASICIPKLSHILITRPNTNIRRTIWDVKNNILHRIQEKLSPKTFALFSLIFLGHKQLVKKEMNQIKEYYKAWGISHHLARSGLHLVIFIALWGFFLNLLPIRYTTKELLLLGICFVYLFLSWTSISFLRAFFTFVVYKICTLSVISTHAVHVLTIVTFFTLLLNPLQLFFLDFQLSFGLTGALAWFNLVGQIQKIDSAKNC